MSKWTHFWDMHSGGNQKLDYGHIYIEASEDEAKCIFRNKFNRNPDNVTCSCCGEDYSIDESDSLKEASRYQRNIPYYESGKESKYVEPGEEIPEGWTIGKYHFNKGPGLSLDDYINSGKALVLFKKDL